jgi:hypothetical protein
MSKRSRRSIGLPPGPSALDHMLCWTPGTAQVATVPLSRHRDNSEPYENSVLACNARTHEMTVLERMLHVFMLATVLIQRDKCDPAAVHRALSKLSEYRSNIPPDLPPEGGWRLGDWQLTCDWISGID